MTPQDALAEIKRICGACPRHTDPAVLTCAQGTCEAIIGLEDLAAPEVREVPVPQPGGPAGPAAGPNSVSSQYEVVRKKDYMNWMKPIRHCLRCRFTECSMMGVHREVHCAFYE